MVPLPRKRPDPAPNDLTYTCPLCGYKIADHEILPTALLQSFGGPVKMGLHTSGAGHVRFQVASF